MRACLCQLGKIYSRVSATNVTAPGFRIDVPQSESPAWTDKLCYDLRACYFERASGKRMQQPRLVASAVQPERARSKRTIKKTKKRK
eukprot:3791223-Pyramimonas_sp.AAC.1